MIYEDRDVRWKGIGDTKKLCDIPSLVPYEGTVIQLNSRKAVCPYKISEGGTVTLGSTEHDERKCGEQSMEEHRDKIRN